MNKDKYDVIIVGMGLAGIHFSFACRQKKLKVLHLHQSTLGESTNKAAGLINPITGRRYVKSWLIDEVMPYALQRYDELEQLLNNKYVSNLDIIRVLKDAGDENTWLSKTADPYLGQFMLEAIIEDGFTESLKKEKMLGQLSNCNRVDIKQLQIDYINLCRDEGSLMMDMFDYGELEISNNSLTYKELNADHIVFAEGWKVLDNPYFQIPAFAPAKGELLLIHAPELKIDKAYKKDQFIVPLGEDMYWIGASYEWQNYDPNPTDKMRSRLIEKLDHVIRVPYEIKHHIAGIRPASKDRKPVIGTHETHKNVHVFNGMGTKGTSLAPLFSNQLVNQIWDGIQVLDEVDVARYYKA